MHEAAQTIRLRNQLEGIKAPLDKPGVDGDLRRQLAEIAGKLEPGSARTQIPTFMLEP